jgi:hypothetical protein
MHPPEVQSKTNFACPLSIHRLGASPSDFGSTTYVRCVAELFTVIGPLPVRLSTNPSQIVPGSITLLPTLKANGTSTFIELCAEATPAVTIRTAAAVAILFVKRFIVPLHRAALAFPVYAEEECNLLATAPSAISFLQVIENACRPAPRRRIPSIRVNRPVHPREPAGSPTRFRS